MTELLPAALLGRLERLQLATRRPLAGRFTGEHRSPRKGTSLDFAEHRPYHPGDDFRRIDYNLYARLDVLAVKLFEAEDELHLRLLLDTSGSMGLHGKLDQALRVAAALGFVALVRRDPVSIHTFPAGPTTGGPPRFTGGGAVPRMLGHLGSIRAGGTTDVAAAALDLLARPGPQGLTVLVSDLLTPGWSDGIRRLPARGGDLAVVHLLAREELEPSLVGDLDLRDVEDGSRVEVSLTPPTLAAHRRHVAAWADDVAAAARRSGAAYVRLLADADIERALLGSWRRAGMLR